MQYAISMWFCALYSKQKLHTDFRFYKCSQTIKKIQERMQCVLQVCWLCVFCYSRGARKLTVEAEDGVSAYNEQVANSAVSAWAQYQRVLYLFLPMDISGSVLPWDNFTGHLVHPLFWRLLLIQPAYSLTFLIGKTFWGIERLPLMNGCDFPNANPTINLLFSLSAG